MHTALPVGIQAPRSTPLQNRLTLMLPTAGGALAGALIFAAFANSVIISPLVFYGMFAAAGALYGTAAGLAIRLQLPRFSALDIARYAATVAAGFTIGVVLGITLNQLNVFPILLSALIFPPVIGWLAGQFARRWITRAGGFLHDARPGWAVGALPYGPLVALIGAVLFSTAPYVMTSTPILPLALVPAALAGAVGGLLSGIISRGYIRRGLAARAKRDTELRPHLEVPAVQTETANAAALGALVSEAHPPAEALRIVEDVEGMTGKPKPKARIDVPLPETPRQWRMVGLAALVSFVAAGVLFALVFAFVTPRAQFFYPPQMVPAPTMMPFASPPAFDPLMNWSQPVLTLDFAAPFTPDSPIIPPDTPVYVRERLDTVDGPVYIIEDMFGNLGRAPASALRMPDPTPDWSQGGPRFAVGMRVHVANLDPSTAGFVYWWVTDMTFLPVENEWIYEVSNGAGIILMRSEAQLIPADGAPTPGPTPMPTPTIPIALT